MILKSKFVTSLPLFFKKQEVRYLSNWRADSTWTNLKAFSTTSQR